MCWQAKLGKAEEQAHERFFAALSPPIPLPPLMAVVGSKLAAGESYWLVKPLEPPYALEKVEFGLNAGFWVIKVQHYRLVNIDKHTNKRSYKLSDEVNTYSLSACVQHLRVKFAIPRSECVLAGATHKAILEESGVGDRTEGFFPK